MPSPQSARPVRPRPRSRTVEQPADGTTRYPFLTVTGTCVGTLVAIALTPADPQPKWALFTSAVAMTAGLVIGPALAALRDPKSLLSGAHLLTLAPIYWLLLDLLQGAYEMEGVSADAARLAFLFIGLFVVGVWLAGLTKPWRLPNSLMRTAAFDMPPGAVFTIALLSFVLGIFKYAQPCGFDPVKMAYYLGQGRFDAPWSRGAMGGWDAFRDVMQYFGYLLPALAVLLANRVGWANLRTIFVIILALVMALFLAQEGGRRSVGVIFGMAIILWVISQRRLGAKGVAVLVISAAVLLFAMQTMLNYRGVGFASVFDKNVEVTERGYVHVDDNFYRLCQTIQIVPSKYPHTYHQYFFYILVRPVPRVFWPGKPIDGGFDLAASVEVAGASLSNSVVGELYVSGGFLVVLLGGWLYGRLVGMANSLLSMGGRIGAHVFYGTWMMALFTGIRSMLDLVLISYVIFAWVGLCWLFQFFSGDAAPVGPARRQPARQTP